VGLHGPTVAVENFYIIVMDFFHDAELRARRKRSSRLVSLNSTYVIPPLRPTARRSAAPRED
jgi:hypothetical protein